MAQWIVVEGIDGCGKTHAIELIKSKLESHGYNVIVTRGIGTGEIGKVVREQVIHNKVKNNARAFFTFAAHIDNYNEVMKHIKKKNTVIITDRYLTTFYAYNFIANQDIGSETIIKTLCKDFIFDKKPNYTLFIDTKAEIAKNRTSNRKDQNSIDKKDLEYYEITRQAFILSIDKQNKNKEPWTATVKTTTIVNNHSLPNFEKKVNEYLNSLLIVNDSGAFEFKGK